MDLGVMPLTWGSVVPTPWTAVSRDRRRRARAARSGLAVRRTVRTEACEHALVNDPSRPHREACARCLRPASTCLCALAMPTHHRTEVLVLQHPKEQRQAKNSVTLLRLSLVRCEVVVGDRFAPEVLAALLHRPGSRSVLLYPDTPAVPAASRARVTSGMPIRLVVIDATWRKSLRLLLEHPALAALPRWSLDAPPPTRYRAIRAVRRAIEVSTLEATVQALVQLEGPGFDAAPLLDAFGRFVAGVAARQHAGLMATRSVTISE